MKSILLALITLFTAVAQAQTVKYECVPSVATTYLTKVTISEDDLGYAHMNVYDGKASVTAEADYGDDVDTIFYFAETLDMQIEFSDADMQDDGTAQGTYIANASFKTGDRQVRIQVSCKQAR